VDLKLRAKIAYGTGVEVQDFSSLLTLSENLIFFYNYFILEDMKPI